MIIRDSVTPRGRIEDSGPTKDYSRLVSIATGWRPLPEDETWQSLNARLDHVAFKNTIPRKAPPVLDPWDITCEACHKTFKTNRTHTKYCGDACRQRAHKRRKKGLTP